jgi:hypothetical protein
MARTISGDTIALCSSVEPRNPRLNSRQGGFGDLGERLRRQRDLIDTSLQRSGIQMPIGRNRLNGFASLPIWDSVLKHGVNERTDTTVTCMVDT